MGVVRAVECLGIALLSTETGIWGQNNVETYMLNEIPNWNTIIWCQVPCMIMV